MPPKSQKSTASSKGEANTRAGVTKRSDGARKRTQNRIAQQCLRERRAASSRHMDNVFNTMKFASEADQSQRFAVLLEAHMKLVKENELMEDALFRLRKKLLSLSNAAAMAADDSVFDMILGREQRREPSSESSDVQQCESVAMNDADKADGGDGNSAPSDPQPDQPGSPEDTRNGQSPGTIVVHEPSNIVKPGDSAGGSTRSNSMSSNADLASAETVHNNFLAFSEVIDEIVVSLNDAPSDLASFQLNVQHLDPEESPKQQQHQHQPLDLLDDSELLGPPIDPSLFNDLDLTSLIPDLLEDDGTRHTEQLPSPWDICSFAPTQKLIVRSSNDFSNKILHASFKCISRAEQSGLVRHLSTDQLTQQVAVAAVNLLGKASGMQRYIYGTNGAPYMERVMYWRLATAARALVPCPFRPTPLQCSVNMPNLAIDFVNWPEIRDQMLLAGTSIELDAVYRDLVLNTVIEIPEKQVAVNVYRQFHTSIDANSPRPSCDSSEPGPPTSAVDPGWVFFEINREDPDFQSWTPDPVEEALARMLWRWIQRLSHHHDLSLFRATSVDDAAKVTVPESPLGLLDSKFCKKRTSIFDALANTKDWRLSKEFAAKYPFMDCSSACTNYVTIPTLSTVI